MRRRQVGHSQQWPTDVTGRRERWNRYGTAVAATLLVLVALIGLGTLVAIHVFSARSAAATDRNRRVALTRLAPQARVYADAVVANSHETAGPSDETLIAIRTRGIEIRRTTRQPELSLVIVSAAFYGGLFGPGEVTACYRVDFHELGTTYGRYDLAEQQCPVASLAPLPSPSAGATR